AVNGAEIRAGDDLVGRRFLAGFVAELDILGPVVEGGAHERFLGQFDAHDGHFGSGLPWRLYFGLLPLRRALGNHGRIRARQAPDLDLDVIVPLVRGVAPAVEPDVARDLAVAVDEEAFAGLDVFLVVPRAEPRR